MHVYADANAHIHAYTCVYTQKPEGVEEIQRMYKCNTNNIAFVGDRILTDVVFGNMNNMYTIYTQPLTLVNDNKIAKQVYICIYTCIYVYTHECIYEYVLACIHTHVYIYIYRHAKLCVCNHCIHTYIYVIYKNMHKYVYTFTVYLYLYA